MPAVAKSFPGSDDPTLATRRECACALAPIGRRIKVLKAIDWPVELEERFLTAWKRGQPELPSPPTQPQVLADEIAALEALMQRIDRGHPLGNWLYKAAWSYHVAALMLAGTASISSVSSITRTRSPQKPASVGDHCLLATFAPSTLTRILGNCAGDTPLPPALALARSPGLIGPRTRTGEPSLTMFPAALISTGVTCRFDIGTGARFSTTTINSPWPFTCAAAVTYLSGFCGRSRRTNSAAASCPILLFDVAATW